MTNNSPLTQGLIHDAEQYWLTAPKPSLSKLARALGVSTRSVKRWKATGIRHISERKVSLQRDFAEALEVVQRERDARNEPAPAPESGKPSGWGREIPLSELRKSDLEGAYWNEDREAPDPPTDPREWIWMEKR